MFHVLRHNRKNCNVLYIYIFFFVFILVGSELDQQLSRKGKVIPITDRGGP
jgi:hypothetical protein